MEYTEVTVSTSTQGAELVSDIFMRLGAAGTQILDRADLPDPNKPTANWELMDQSVIDAMPEDVQVKAWFDEESLQKIIGSLREQLSLLKGPGMGTLDVSLQRVKEEDWAENWKQYYKPFRIGQHMVVKPTWEPWDTQEGDLIIEIDPGMAFGTGTHETTSMCVSLIESITGAAPCWTWEPAAAFWRLPRQGWGPRVSWLWILIRMLCGWPRKT